MPTASAGIQGRGWQYYHQAKTATRKLPLHVDLSTRRPFSASSSTEKVAPPPTWAAPGAARKPSWVEMAALLRQYAQREGHARVPLGHEESGVRLGVWLSRQWSEHMAGRLSQDRTWRLEKVGVDWGGAPPEASGSIGPRHLNERKWDDNRAHVLAAQAGKSAEFDPTPRALAAGREPSYDAARDPHLCKLWARREPPPPKNAKEVAEPFPPFGVPRAKGLPPELGRRLLHAKGELERDRRERRDATGAGSGTLPPPASARAEAALSTVLDQQAPLQGMRVDGAATNSAADQEEPLDY